MAATISDVVAFSNKGTVEVVKPGGADGSSTSQPTAPAIKPPGYVPPPIYAQAGGSIRTEADGEASLILGELGSARMTADSEVRVPDPSEGHSLETLKGQLFLNVSAEEIKKGGDKEFKLKTPAALLAVKGTRFFTLCRDGTDTIGVHEGSVQVTEPTSGKSLNLTSGQAVSVTSGSLGEVRSLNDQEKAEASQYDLASLKRIPLSLATSVANQTMQTYVNGKLLKGLQDMKGIPFLKWEELREFKPEANMFPSKGYRSSKPVLTDQGVVRYLWTPPYREQSYRYTALSNDVNSWLSKVLSAGANPVAIQFKIRGKDIQRIDCCLTTMFRYLSFEEKDVRASTVTNGEWITMTVPFLKDQNQRYCGNLEVMLLPAQNRSGTRLLSTETSAIEMKDFILFTTSP